MINIEYEKYVGYVLGIHHNGRKMLKGKFKEKGGKRIITEELKCLCCSDDANKSYKATVSYFNHTRRNEEKERIFVSAEWIKEESKSL